jgi:hypothetical protein
VNIDRIDPVVLAVADIVRGFCDPYGNRIEVNNYPA